LEPGPVAPGYSSAQLYVEGKKALWLALVVSDALLDPLFAVLLHVLRGR
jgi:hypothetical protein